MSDNKSGESGNEPGSGKKKILYIIGLIVLLLLIGVGVYFLIVWLRSGGDGGSSKPGSEKNDGNKSTGGASQLVSFLGEDDDKMYLGEKLETN